MKKELYDMIFKRKSFHYFKEVGEETLTEEDIKEIEEYFYSLTPLVKDIKVKIKFTKNEPGKDRNEQYLIYFYSEVKDNYLQNIGYLGEQLDLYFASKNIGALWYGLGETSDVKYEGLDFVIMMAISKVTNLSKFREDMFKCDRKSLEEIYNGKEYKEVFDIARFSPSACNTQPWLIEEKDNALNVYRNTKAFKPEIISNDKMVYCNQIDIGIFLCILETCLLHNNYSFERTLYPENKENDTNLSASYIITK